MFEVLEKTQWGYKKSRVKLHCVVIAGDDNVPEFIFINITLFGSDSHRKF